MIADKLGYKRVAAQTLVIKPGPGGLFAMICVAAGDLTVYDNPSAGSGTPLFVIAGATAGQVFHFGGTGIAANSGMTAVATGAWNITYQ